MPTPEPSRQPPEGGLAKDDPSLAVEEPDQVEAPSLGEDVGGTEVGVAEPGDAGADGLTSRVIPAAVVLGDGRGQAIAVLVMRILRSASITLLVVGAGVALGFGRLTESEVTELTSIGGLLAALRTPLVVLASGVALRLLIAPLALFLAWEVVVRSHRDVAPAEDHRKRFSRFADRFRVASGLRDFRWTMAVRQEAAARLGGLGRILVLTELGVRALTGVGVITFLVVSAVR